MKKRARKETLGKADWCPKTPYPNGAPENGIIMEGHHKDESIDRPWSKAEIIWHFYSSKLA